MPEKEGTAPYRIFHWIIKFLRSLLWVDDLWQCVYFIFILHETYTNNNSGHKGLSTIITFNEMKVSLEKDGELLT